MVYEKAPREGSLIEVCRSAIRAMLGDIMQRHSFLSPNPPTRCNGFFIAPSIREHGGICAGRKPYRDDRELSCGVGIVGGNRDR